VLGTLNVASLRDSAWQQADVDLLGQVAAQVAIAVENAVAVEEIARLQNRLAQEKLYLEDEIRTEFNFEEIVGDSPKLRAVLRQVETVAPTDSTVLIGGETGTGKELIARAIHNLSARRDRTFIKINCAAIPVGLLESELFGHERGAFTGAIAQKLGRFELADQGTIFLDEVGDIPLDLQQKLLRVLQDRAVERVGATRPLQLDLRIIAATNRNLKEMVARGEFRADLYYRLKVFPITIPPLRDRPEDVPALILHYLRKYSQRMRKSIASISPAAMEVLTKYPWPGNVRELQHFIERCVVLTTGSILQVPLKELEEVIRKGKGTRAPAPARTMEEIEREAILEALRATNWVVGGPQGAAARLGVKRTTLASRIERLKIRRP